MIIFPAIDIKGGKCVRLLQGDYGKVETFGDHPVEMARRWYEEGGEYLHIVDLDGALLGEAINKQIIKNIVKEVCIPIQFGGGIRSMAYLEEILDAGVSRAILGTSALNDKAFTKQALEKYADKMAVSIDAKNGFAAANGWTKVSDIKAAQLCKELEDYGLSTIVYTDIAKDGMMMGPNFEELAFMKENVNAKIIASGGVSTKEDVERLRSMGLYGAIIGKAIYTGDIQLSEVVQGGRK